MLTQDILLTSHLTKDMEQFATQNSNALAFEHALETRCSESEESSDDSYSSDGSRDDEDEREEQEVESTLTATGPRRPTCLNINPLFDRRASAPSQRSPLSITSPRRLSNYNYGPPTTSPRTPSTSMRHDAALRSFQMKRDQETQSLTNKSSKPRPAMMNIACISNINASRIEIEQVYDDEDEEMEMARRDAEIAKADRSAARKRMLTTLGRGQSQSKPAMPLPMKRTHSRRVPSLDQISNMYQSRSLDEIRTPAPKTPGTASPFRHQRNASCPTPTSPYTQQYGEVEVTITPPTPRPQGPDSPTLGVFVSGLHGRGRLVSNQNGDYLTPPAFELAPGKQKALEIQRALALMASLQSQQEQLEQLRQQQQQVLHNPVQPGEYNYMLDAFGLMGMPSNLSPSIIPGTPGAPSMIHIQQQKALLAQQKAMHARWQTSPYSPPTKTLPSPPKSSSSNRTATPNANKQQSPASSKTWWRNSQEANVSANAASSASAYSKSSAALSSSPPPSMADSSPAWRRRAPSVESSEKVQSAGPVYLPPGKRAAMLKQQKMCSP